jgi:hypothetical protein
MGRLLSMEPGDPDLDAIRIDRTAFSVVSLGDESDDRAYWMSRSIEERLEAVEIMRRINFGYDPDTSRLQRVLEIVTVEWG